MLNRTKELRDLIVLEMKNRDLTNDETWVSNLKAINEEIEKLEK